MKINIKDFCKSLFLSKTFIALICILLGASAVLLVQNIASSKTNSTDNVLLNGQKNIAEINENLFPDNRALFAEMDAMEKRVSEIFKAHHEHMKATFDRAAKSNVEINQANVFIKEDNNFYYYELNFSGFKKQDIAVGIKDNDLSTFFRTLKLSIFQRFPIHFFKLNWS